MDRLEFRLDLVALADEATALEFGSRSGRSETDLGRFGDRLEPWPKGLAGRQLLVEIIESTRFDDDLSKALGPRGHPFGERAEHSACSGLGGHRLIGGSLAFRARAASGIGGECLGPLERLDLSPSPAKVIDDDRARLLELRRFGQRELGDLGIVIGEQAVQPAMLIREARHLGRGRRRSELRAELLAVAIPSLDKPVVPLGLGPVGGRRGRLAAGRAHGESARLIGRLTGLLERLCVPERLRALECADLAGDPGGLVGDLATPVLRSGLGDRRRLEGLRGCRDLLASGVIRGVGGPELGAAECQLARRVVPIDAEELADGPRGGLRLVEHLLALAEPLERVGLLGDDDGVEGRERGVQELAQRLGFEPLAELRAAHREEKGDQRLVTLGPETEQALVDNVPVAFSSAADPGVEDLAPLTDPLGQSVGAQCVATAGLVALPQLELLADPLVSDEVVDEL